MGLPRTRGGVSEARLFQETERASSPHTRGCFWAFQADRGHPSVFPAHAGVFLVRMAFDCDCKGLPRTRGGVSGAADAFQLREQSSPHTRGCFYRRWIFPQRLGVFPAHAGVFPPERRLSGVAVGLPRTRGGVSFLTWTPTTRPTSSPHTRGCFYLARHRRSGNVVFPAHAGVCPGQSILGNFRQCLPRVRGGVSYWKSFTRARLQSSPRPRGCFRHKAALLLVGGVFPASAGVFLVRRIAWATPNGLPRVRGGVSAPSCSVKTVGGASPRPRGCFPVSSPFGGKSEVFPASAGVFPVQ